jgi:cell pole-organizing protein PopZ
MGDVSSEPTMEEILSSIKRVIEESEAAPSTVRPRRTPRTNEPRDMAPSDEILELHERAPFPAADRLPPRVVVDRPPVEDIAIPRPARPESILSPDAAEASRGPLEALSRMIVKPESAGGDTLEGMVREMLRPMLREWLDAQLPGIVEAMVAKEIARISGRGL